MKRKLKFGTCNYCRCPRLNGGIDLAGLAGVKQV